MIRSLKAVFSDGYLKCLLMSAILDAVAVFLLSMQFSVMAILGLSGTMPPLGMFLRLAAYGLLFAYAQGAATGSARTLLQTGTVTMGRFFQSGIAYLPESVGFGILYIGIRSLLINGTAFVLAYVHVGGLVTSLAGLLLVVMANTFVLPWYYLAVGCIPSGRYIARNTLSLLSFGVTLAVASLVPFADSLLRAFLIYHINKENSEEQAAGYSDPDFFEVVRKSMI